jgi:hypothetical protein
VQSFGSLAAIITLLIVAWSLQWLRPMGVAYLGKWQAWPIVIIHAFSNMAVSMKPLTETGWSLSVSGLIGVILLQLPLVIVGLWLLQRQGPRPVVPDVP